MMTAMFIITSNNKTPRSLNLRHLVFPCTWVNTMADSSQFTQGRSKVRLPCQSKSCKVNFASDDPFNKNNQLHLWFCLWYSLHGDPITIRVFLFCLFQVQMRNTLKTLGQTIHEHYFKPQGNEIYTHTQSLAMFVYVDILVDELI